MIKKKLMSYSEFSLRYVIGNRLWERLDSAANTNPLCPDQQYEIVGCFFSLVSTNDTTHDAQYIEIVVGFNFYSTISLTDLLS